MTAVDPKVKKEIQEALSVFDRIAKKAIAKNMQHSNPFLVEQKNHGYKPDNMLQETYSPTRSGTTMMNQIEEQFKPKSSAQFSVFALPNEHGKTRYDVANTATGQKLVGGIALAECANGIAKLMNKGHSFYSPQIQSLLEYEQNYTKYYNDALNFKKKISNNSSKDLIVETRFEEAKLKAQETKRRLVEYVTKL